MTPWEAEPGMRRTGRRQLLGAAGAIVAASGLGVLSGSLSGCAPVGLAGLPGLLAALRVRIIGLPPDVGQALGEALQGCAQSYSSSGGFVRLDISVTPIPDLSWYGQDTCGGPNVGCFAEAVEILSAAQMSRLSSQGQLWANGAPLFLVRGRTRYRVKFGDGTLARVQPALERGAGPDIVLSYDLWQYWLVPFAEDMAPAWRLYGDYRDGLLSNVDRFGQFYSAANGTFLAAAPVLRNPMVLLGAGSLADVTPWDWGQVVQSIVGGVHPVPTSGFDQDPLYPESTEAAAAAVVAYGGTLAHATSSSVVETLSTTPTLAALAGLGALMKRDQSTGSGVAVGLRPSYLWDPLWGDRRNCWSCFGGPVRPLPAGPARRAVPCVYLCASVFSTSRHIAAAQEFCNFLLSKPAQAQLAHWAGGLPMRPGDAVPILKGYSQVQAAEEIASGADDLTASDLYGGEETGANEVAYDDAADAFSGVLGGYSRSSVGP